MSEAVIVALITGICAVVGEIIVSAQSTKKLYRELDKQSAISDERIHGELAVVRQEISELRRDVERHNQVVSRVYDLEVKSAKHDEQIKTLFAK